MRSIFSRRTKLRFMWWRHVIDDPHKSFDTCHNQASTFRWVLYELIYRLIVCYPKLYFLKICSNFHIHDEKTYNFVFSLKYVSLCKKNSSPLLLHLNKCKLSYFIGYRYLNLRLKRDSTCKKPSLVAQALQNYNFHNYYCGLPFAIMRCYYFVLITSLSNHIT